MDNVCVIVDIVKSFNKIPEVPPSLLRLQMILRDLLRLLYLLLLPLLRQQIPILAVFHNNIQVIFLHIVNNLKQFDHIWVILVQSLKFEK